MKKILLLLLLGILASGLKAQHFPFNDVSRKKSVVVLTNPTVNNLKTIHYLLDHNLLRINQRRTVFVGVFFEEQEYDFSKTLKYLTDNSINNFHLHKVSGSLDLKNLFRKNEISPEIETIFNHSAGIFFFGGPDIPPAVYQEDNSRSVVTDPQRHYFETTFLFHLLGSSRNESFRALLEEKPDYFVTGFCLGLQTMNVATGGTLIQDIPAEIYNTTLPEKIVKLKKDNLHRNYWQEISDDPLLMNINLHPLKFTDHPFFENEVKIRKNQVPLVYSSHHQAIEDMGKGLEVTAVSPDEQVIEAVVHRKFPHVSAVQFHPEVPALYEPMYKRTFHPDDLPYTYHEAIGKEGVKFHKRYWKYISQTLNRALRKQKKKTQSASLACQ
ncbi:MAG: gamma-glutamyl-gamma-aminobutyrate hydrolase family protein [Mariniphaga sp.]|nr:gamma-glutamyl-gamma-aminobutyrate hydrolase family protein [Mariniphaga sp.]MDD4226634.1 gamma-glutamyl-gamma-aminobutyrate hydrolase family protein [Mariniphaga sp.]MDD4425697.1 gamma-glutamyl-gamma-aminobutyrate hydrolase family protein [Mariniphaga sp.]